MMNVFERLPVQLSDMIDVLPSGCWLWRGYKGGYGHMQFHGTNHLAHRLVYEAVIGEIPVGLQIDHLCRNRGCVNPAHLEPVTQSVNHRRGNSAIRKTHCKVGHPMTEENVRVLSTGKRACYICMLRRNREYKKKVRAARRSALVALFNNATNGGDRAPSSRAEEQAPTLPVGAQYRAGGPPGPAVGTVAPIFTVDGCEVSSFRSNRYRAGTELWCETHERWEGRA